VKRGELYLVRKPGSNDPRKQRVFATVSRQVRIDSRFSSVICAPIYSQHDGLSTQVRVGIEEGLKRFRKTHQFIAMDARFPLFSRTISVLWIANGKWNSIAPLLWHLP
jgi:mRNA interferase MazF